MCSDVPGRVEEWHIPRKTASKWVRYRLQTRTVEQLSTRHQTVLVTFLGFRKSPYSCIEGMRHSSTCPGTSLHTTQFYQAFPRVSTASDKHWGEKAWVRGYFNIYTYWNVEWNMITGLATQQLWERSHPTAPKRQVTNRKWPQRCRLVMKWAGPGIHIAVLITH